MSIYVCDRCGCIENSAYGSYYLTNFGRDNAEYGMPEGELWCHACCPHTKADGTKVPEPYRLHNYGNWHNRFDRILWRQQDVYNRVTIAERVRMQSFATAYFLNPAMHEKGDKKIALIHLQQLRRDALQRQIAVKLTDQYGTNFPTPLTDLVIQKIAEFKVEHSKELVIIR